jgi:hypothetical protein
MVKFRNQRRMQGNDLPSTLVPYVKLEFSSAIFLFLRSGTPLALEDGNSKNCAALLSEVVTLFPSLILSSDKCPLLNSSR